ncbi:hypothetical protein GGX14DRAFT_661022, partial [Mycena pura]
FGFLLTRALGIGHAQELVAQLTHTPIATHNSSTNTTLDDSSITFPGQSLYVDAMHEVVVLHSRCPVYSVSMFRASQLMPFATNAQFQ